MYVRNWLTSFLPILSATPRTARIGRAICGRVCAQAWRQAPRSSERGRFRFLLIETATDGGRFFDHPSAPLLCAREIARNVHDEIPLRIGIHSGLIGYDVDAHGSPNLYGDGINTAQRVMDCGRPATSCSHARLPKRSSLWREEWRSTLHNLGTYPVKHTRVGLYKVSRSRLWRGQSNHSAGRKSAVGSSGSSVGSLILHLPTPHSQ